MPTFSGDALARWAEGTWDPAPPPAGPLSGVFHDTRKGVRGALYAALKGPRFDGHAFVDAALASGAAAALVDRGYARSPAAAGAPLLRVTDTREALRRLALGYRRDLAVEIVAVTGSAGKSTVKEMTAHLLEGAMRVARTRGNWNNDIGLPLSLLAMERDTRIGVFEVGTNHPGELAPLCSLLEPRWGLLTNVGPAHLEYFGTLAGVAREKSTVLRAVPPDGTCVLWTGTERFEDLRSAVPGRLVTVALEGRADYLGAGAPGGDSDASVAETATGERFVFKPPLPGRHNLLNALFAVAVARGHGMGWEAIRAGFDSFTPLPMRWARTTAGGLTWIEDEQNASPLSMRAALETFAATPAEGRKWLVLGGMLELGPDEERYHRDVGRLAARSRCDGLVAVGGRGGWIADGAAEAGMPEARIARCGNAASAASVLFERTKRGDTVLLKASRAMRLEDVRSEYVLLAV